MIFEVIKTGKRQHFTKVKNPGFKKTGKFKGVYQMVFARLHKRVFIQTLRTWKWKR